MSFVAYRMFNLLASRKRRTSWFPSEKDFEYKMVLTGGPNPKHFYGPDGRTIIRTIYKPFYYFGPVVHRAPLPTTQNMHGIWSFRTTEQMHKQGYLGSIVTARVRAFGKVLEYEHIYRSSSILIEKIVLYEVAFASTIFAPERLKELENRYQCEVVQAYHPLEVENELNSP